MNKINAIGQTLNQLKESVGQLKANGIIHVVKQISPQEALATAGFLTVTLVAQYAISKLIDQMEEGITKKMTHAAVILTIPPIGVLSLMYAGIPSVNLIVLTAITYAAIAIQKLIVNKTKNNRLKDKQEIERLKKEKSELEKELKKQNKKISSLKQKKENLKTKENTSEIQRNVHEKEKENLEAEKRKIKEELEKEREKVKTIESKLEISQRQLSTVTNENSDFLKKQYGPLVNRLEELEKDQVSTKRKVVSQAEKQSELEENVQLLRSKLNGPDEEFGSSEETSSFYASESASQLLSSGDA